MIANSAFLAAMALLLLLFWLLGELEFLAPYRRTVLDQYLWTIVGAACVVFVNLFALAYAVTRSLFLKDTGRKLAHVDRQLGTPDTVARDLSARLAGEE
jgi:hypothetical protein